jgi:predicted GH43/DUF377 family glycosyl hydrolase
MNPNSKAGRSDRVVVPVRQAFQPAGAGDFPVARFGGTPDWKVRCTGRLESLPYVCCAAPTFAFGIKLTQLLLLVDALAFTQFAVAQNTTNAAPLDDATMQRLYDEVKTPFKYGVVLRGDSTNQLVDCPSIFRDGRKWFMMYVAITGKEGYETFLAESDDLLNWRKLGKILPFTQSGWDAWQADGGLALVNHEWAGDHSLGKFDGKYWLSYIGGAMQGYEPDPLSIGMAWTTTPTQSQQWKRVKQNPVLTPCDADVREFERLTLYKSSIIHDREQRLGAPFVMYYNAKNKNGYERIGMALSTNMVDWTRFGTNCVLANGEEKRNGMSGDPQLVKIGNTWVMFYFGAGWGPKAFDTFAASPDMVNWTKWTGPKLIEPSEPWDKTYAHKPWVLKHEGVVYHYYCAVGTEGRVIGLATSKDLHVEKKQP